MADLYDRILLAIEHNLLLSWLEPEDEIWFISAKDAIALMTDEYARRHIKLPDEQSILMDFVIVHWADISL